MNNTPHRDGVWIEFAFGFRKRWGCGGMDGLSMGSRLVRLRLMCCSDGFRGSCAGVLGGVRAGLAQIMTELKSGY